MDVKLADLDYAVSLVERGDQVTISGISIHRNPIRFIRALIDRGVRGLKFVDREPGYGLELMLRNHMIDQMRVAMSTLEWFSGIPPAFRRAVESGEVDLLEDTCGAFIAGIRAGAFGVPFGVVRGVLGSDLVKLHRARGTWEVITDPFSGGEILAVKAITPDVSVIHVHRADVYGNGEILGPVYEDEYKARASRKVILTAEEIVDPSYFKGKRPSISALHTTAVVLAPRGAEPTSMFGMYDADYEEILDVLSP